ncbi:mandelate racemase/muconate lactonizing enzyme family protein [Pseudonocardia kunmingensis]|uniref:D-galactarolactone cycloisomerase n=1 Tax=Pseudonocardia kunmingensis TaxID=630975 RepID=A0A543DVJ5_9PSEU|nr:mandelate racemase/muconate lactonizing enzyme family protein [Pseudonocardia kunmingensis]TQM13329.1 D-galactarolactone cycloisomerase [Pseudonocardia kunmingensis]
MKIECIDTFVLRVPLGARRFYSSQAAFPERTSMLVRVTSTDGVVGWGEGGQYGPAEPVKACIDEVLAPQVLAMPEAMPAVVAETLYARTRDFGQKGTYVEAISAIDIALWDLLGRTLGAPVSTLLGGRFRERVKAYGTSGYYTDPEFRADRDLPGLAEAVIGHVADGFDMLKMKIGLLPIAQDAARIRTVREAVGDDVVLLADANHAYNAATAIRVGRVLDEHGFACFEEPVVPEDRAGYSRVRSAVDVPISGGEAEFTRYGFRDFIEQARVDIVQPDLCVCGGFTETQRIATLASTHGARTVPHVWGSAVALAAALQMCSVLPLSPYTLRPIPLQNEPVIEFDRTPNPLRDELLVEPFRLRDGHLDVPTGAGLGIEIDLDQLERYRTA